MRKILSGLLIIILFFSAGIETSQSELKEEEMEGTNYVRSLGTLSHGG